MRIAQITDLHLRHHQPGLAGLNERRARLMPTLLERVLTEAKSHNPDLLAITGDLLDVPGWLLEPAYGFAIDDPQPWLAAVEADYRLIKNLLDTAGLRYVVLPGNHDSPELLWKVFGRDEDVFDLAGHRVACFADREYVCHMPRRFLHERHRFDEVLADEQSPPQIHLQHYVLTPELNQGYPHTYAEGEELARRVAAGPVRLCLSGHYHDGTGLIRQGNTFFSTGMAFCRRPYPWRLYDIDPAGQVTMTQYVLETRRPMPRRVVFLDRDGVINDLPSYRVGPEAMRLIPGTARAIRRLNEADYAVVVVTSQSAVGCGYVTEGVVLSVHDKMSRLLAEEAGAQLDGIYYSTGSHQAVLPRYQNTDNAKPHPTLLYKAVDELNLTLEGGWMVGDRLSDLRTAVNAGIRPVLVRTGLGMQSEKEGGLPGDTVIADDLAAAVDFILK